MIIPQHKPQPAIINILIFFPLFFLISFKAEPSNGFDQTYALYATVLSKYVKNGHVDYIGIKSSPGELTAFLESTAKVSKDEFETWTEDQQLAFLINVYNARTIELIIDNYPVESIRDIKKDGKGPWDQPVVKIFSGIITLNQLENGVIRKNYNEPRIHFALVCASIGCPPLLDKPYTGANLDTELETQTKKFLSDARKNSIDRNNKTLRVSPIFEWYAGDFEKVAGSPADFLKKYYGGFPLDGYIIAYTDYDWSLNDLQKR